MTATTLLRYATYAIPIVLALSVRGYAEESLEGYWNGNIRAIFQDVVLEADSKGDGSYTVSVQMSRRSGQKWTADTVTFENGVLRAKFDALNSLYLGKLTEKGNMLDGNWYLDGDPLALTLERSNAAKLRRGYDWLTPTKAAPSGVRFSVRDLDGRIVSSESSELKGKVLLIDVWGTWCPPCREAVPHLIKLQDKYKSRGFEVIGFHHARITKRETAESLAKLKKFMRDQGINYTVLNGYSYLDPATADFNGQIDGILGLEDFGRFPTSILLDRQGKVDYIEAGFSLDSISILDRRIEALVSRHSE